MRSPATPPSLWAAWWSVFRRDARALFVTPLGWVFLSAWLFLSGLLFTLGLMSTDEASLRGALPNLAVTLLFLLPLATMRSFAEEARTGTLELLLTSPLPLGSLLMGKWAAVMLLATVMLVGTTPFVGVLVTYGDPDLAVLALHYGGLWVCAALFTAVGVWTSSLTSDQMVAAVAAILVLLPSWLASVALDLAPQHVRPWLQRVSFVGAPEGMRPRRARHR